jgi:hypothetical protein
VLVSSSSSSSTRELSVFTVNWCWTSGVAAYVVHNVLCWAAVYILAALSSECYALCCYAPMSLCCPLCMPAYLLWCIVLCAAVLLQMWGFACAYCVLFRRDQEHQVSINMSKPIWQPDYTNALLLKQTC